MSRSRFKSRVRIGVVNFPIPKTNVTPLSHLVDILCSLSDELYLITGNGGSALSQRSNKLRIYLVDHKTHANIFRRIGNYALTQLKISYRLAKLSKYVDLWVFFLGGEFLLPSMLVAKLLRKDAVLALTVFNEKTIEARASALEKLLLPILMINFALARRIIVYSERFIEEWSLQKYRSKISVAQEHFLDFSRFRVERPLDNRDKIVSYIGRLDEEKGILNLVKALPKVLKARADIEFLIVGRGPLKHHVKESLSREGVIGRVKHMNWIPDGEFTEYLNRLQLLVLPSCSEGLPNIVLEAMACGTPVLVTLVGAIPDFIKDSENGFVLENNFPECIAHNIIRALNHPDREEIANNARAFVEKEFTYEGAVEKYAKILADLSVID